MNTLLVVSRALHFGAVLLIFGGLVFALVVVGPATRTSRVAAIDLNERVQAFLRAAGWWGLGASLLSGAAWLFLEAALMSGHPLPEVTGDALWLVLTRTQFGRVWMWRFGIAGALGALMFAAARGGRKRESFTETSLTLVLAAGYLASLALVGHAADGRGVERLFRITTDVVHLLAAGAWLGALPGLAFLLASARGSTAAIGIAGHAAKRFSILGVTSVGALLLSGLGNAWYLVGNVPALLGTPYGRLLVAKLLLFATMVALAATNRQRLTPKVARRDASALDLLTRNAVLEIIGGIAVVAIVGALGAAIPAAHQSPVWPFRFTLSTTPIEESVLNRVILGVCIATLCAIVLAIAFGRGHGKRIGPQTAVVLGSVTAAAILAATWTLSIPAYPTSYASSPVKYTTTVIARGEFFYATNCVQCHGSRGRGDGPSAASLPIKPANLAEHTAHHRPGDLFWWISHGISNTPMPAFSPRLDDEELWALVQYLRALSASQTAQALTTRVEPSLAITAPDFAFEESPHAQEVLTRLRGREVLLVFGALPESLPRLRQIEAQRIEFASAGIRVILTATRSGTSSEGARAIPTPRLAIVDSATTQTYAMFACQPAIPCELSTSPHAELLVDRAGYLRARWLGAPDPGADRAAEIIAGAHQLQREPSGQPTQHEHGQ